MDPPGQPESEISQDLYQQHRVRVRLVREGAPPSIKIRSAQEVYEFFRQLRTFDREVFCSLHLDTRNYVLGCEEVSRGSLSQSLVHPREVYKAAILGNAASIIVAHNHPSGDPAPSSEDHAVTQRLYDAGELIGIPLLDSVIIGCTQYYSIRESDSTSWNQAR